MNEAEETHLEKWDMTNYPKKTVIAIDPPISADVRVNCATRNETFSDVSLNIGVLDERIIDETHSIVLSITSSTVSTEFSRALSPGGSLQSPELNLETSVCFDKIINKLQIENTLLKNNHATLRQYLKLALESIEPLDIEDSTK